MARQLAEDVRVTWSRVEPVPHSFKFGVDFQVVDGTISKPFLEDLDKTLDWEDMTVTDAWDNAVLAAKRVGGIT
jgi:hypothetical protein